MIVVALLALVGCGSPVDCSDAATVLERAGDRELTCAEAGDVADYVHLLAGRPPSALERERVTKDVAARFRDDPAGTEDWIASLVEAGREIEALTGTSGAERRSALVYAAAKGEGLIRAEHGVAYDVQDSALAVWATNDAQKLALTETDIEAWIRYASLCREVQGGGPLRLSVADRVQVYRMIQDRFAAGAPEERVALIALGPYWSQVRDGWQMASYERQQAWIQAAPLPPPMTASSLGYAEAILQGDLVGHAWTLHDRIGPFTMVKGTPAFVDQGAPP